MGHQRLQRNHQSLSRLAFRQPLETTANTVLTVRIRQDSEFRRATMGRFRLALSSSEFSWPTAEKGKEIPDRRAEAPCASPKTNAPTHRRQRWQRTSKWAAPEATVRGRGRGEARAGGGAHVENAIPRVMVSEAVTPCRDADSAARKLDGRIRRDRDAGDPGVPRQARHRRAAARRVSIWRTGWCGRTIR